MYFQPPMQASPREGGGVGAYVYVHIYIHTYVQIAFVRVLWDRRSQGQGHNYTPPPPWGTTMASWALGALLLRPEVGL